MSGRYLLVESLLHEDPVDPGGQMPNDLRPMQTLARLSLVTPRPFVESPRLLLTSAQAMWNEGFDIVAITWSSVEGAPVGGPVPSLVRRTGSSIYCLVWSGVRALEGAPRFDRSPIASAYMLPRNSDKMASLLNRLHCDEPSSLTRMMNRRTILDEARHMLQNGGAIFHCDPTHRDEEVGVIISNSYDIDKLKRLAVYLQGEIFIDESGSR